MNPSSASRDPLSVYDAHAAYPPTSRPLTRAHRELIDWNRRHDPSLPCARDPRLEVRLTADRYWLAGDAPLELELSATRDGAPVALAGLRAEVALRDDTTNMRAPIVLARDVAGRYRQRFAPASVWTGGAAWLEVTASFVAEGALETHVLRAVYQPAATLPARFTGTFRDTIEDGSLVVHAGIDVHEPGRYLVDCNLYDAGGEPVAWARFKGELGAGHDELPLVFFGKALRDHGGPSPWRIGELRGARFVSGAEPDLEPIEPFAGSWSTGRHEASELSDEPWQSPLAEAKRRKLAELAADGAAPWIEAAR